MAVDAQTFERPTSSARWRAGAAWIDLAVCLAATAIAALLILGWPMIDPTNTGWLQNDPAQHFLAWSFFRDEPWEFPLTYTHRLGYPVGVAISLSDAIPLFAVPLKLISPLLPHPFQYLGLFCVASMALNFWFGALLIRQVGHGRLVSYLGGVLFLISPLVLWRLHGHTALTAHWLILAGIYYYLKPVPTEQPRRWFAPFVVLAVLAGAVHPFFVPLTLLFVVAAAARAWWEHRELLPAAFVTLIATPLAVLLVLWALGTISFGELGGLVESGYRTYSMNILGLLDPQGWSGILYSALPTAVAVPGYAYLGLGVIGLLVISVFGLLPALRRSQPTVVVPLLAVSCISIALAISARVTLGPWVLADVPLPDLIEKAMGVFRTSERFVWPAYYLIIVGAFAALIWLPRRFAVAFVGIALIVQIADLQTMITSVSATVSRVREEPPEVTAIRPEIAGLSHLVVLPMWRCNQNETPAGYQGFATFGFLALDLNMTLSNFNASRMTAASTQYHCADAPAAFARGDVDADTAYIVSKPVAASLPPSRRAENCDDRGGFELCVFRAKTP